jgi:hypothetical protein
MLKPFEFTFRCRSGNNIHEESQYRKKACLKLTSAVMTSELWFEITQLSVLSSTTVCKAMALVALGVFFGGVITGIPVVTGVAEGVQHQKEANAEAANETRMVKFYMDAFCDSDEINGMIVVLKHNKVH